MLTLADAGSASVVVSVVAAVPGDDAESEWTLEDDDEVVREATACLERSDLASLRRDSSALTSHDLNTGLRTLFRSTTCCCAVELRASVGAHSSAACGNGVVAAAARLGMAPRVREVSEERTVWMRELGEESAVLKDECAGA